MRRSTYYVLHIVRQSGTGKGQAVKLTKGGDRLGVLRIFMVKMGRDVDLDINKIELRDGVMLITASGIAPCEVMIQDDDVAEVFGVDGKSLCRSWLRVFTPIRGGAGERYSISLPLTFGNMVNFAMADHTLDVDL